MDRSQNIKLRFAARVDDLPTVRGKTAATTEVLSCLILNGIQHNDNEHPTVEVGGTRTNDDIPGRPNNRFTVSRETRKEAGSD